MCILSRSKSDILINDGDTFCLKAPLRCDVCGIMNNPALQQIFKKKKKSNDIEQ